MKKVIAVFGLLFGLAAAGFAGTPQESGTVPSQAGPLSGITILASTAATTSVPASLTLTVSTPTVLNSGGGAFNGRNCFTRIIVQMSTSTVLTVADNATT